MPGGFNELQEGHCNGDTVNRVKNGEKVKEVAAGVPYPVRPIDQGKEFRFYSKCDGKPLEDFGERNDSRLAFYQDHPGY